MEVKPGYKETEVGVIPKEWEVISIGSLASFTSGTGISVASLHRRSSDTPVPVFGGNGIAGYTARPLVEQPTVVVGRVGQKCGEVYLTQGPAWVTDNALYPHIIRRPLDVRFLALALKSAGLNDVKNRNDLPLVTQSILHSVNIAWPHDLAEQRAIAGALADMDTLIGSLEKLIVKKRDLKQAAVQQLLTGQTRLPGFTGKWEVTALDKVASVSKGTQLHNNETNLNGIFAHLNGGISPSGYTNKANTPAYTIAISEGGNSCGYVQFMTERYWCGGHCYSVIPKGIDNRFLYHGLKGQQAAIMKLRVGSGLPNVQKTAILAFKFRYPVTEAEQTAIAGVLSDMDAELEALEARQAKTRTLKQGMMQELLTGRTRLI